MERVALRVGEFADTVGISRSGAYAAIAAGRVPCIRIGPRTVRVPVEAVQDWIRANTHGGADLEVGNSRGVRPLIGVGP